MFAGVAVASIDGAQQRADRRGLPIDAAAVTLERVALDLISDESGDHVHDADVALLPARLGPVARAAERAVERSVGQLDGHRRKRADVGSARYRHRPGDRIGADVADDRRQISVEDTLAVGIRERNRLAIGDPERLAIPFDGLEHLVRRVVPRGIGNLDTEQLAQSDDRTAHRRLQPDISDMLHRGTDRRHPPGARLRAGNTRIERHLLRHHPPGESTCGTVAQPEPHRQDQPQP